MTTPPHLPKPISLLLLALATLSCGPGSEPTEFALRPSPIVNGTLDTSEAHRAVALIRVQAPSGSAEICSGTLITPRVVLTAAHCFSAGEPSQIGVYFGETNREEGTMTRVLGRRYRVHPSFSSAISGYDLAVIQLEEAPPTGVSPIPVLPPELGITQADLHASVEVVGFGLTSVYEPDSYGVKMSASFPIDFICDSETTPCAWPWIYSATRPVAPGQICFRAASGNACSGDSGGPTLLNRNGIDYVAATSASTDALCQVFTCVNRTSGPSESAFIAQFLSEVDAELRCPEGTSCDDGDPNTRDDTCHAGACHGTVPPPPPPPRPSRPHGCATGGTEPLLLALSVGVGLLRRRKTPCASS